MGDGRYYSLRQFYSIVILIVLSVVFISFFVISYLRKSNNNSKIYIVLTYLFLSLMVIFKFIERVIPSFKVAQFSANMSGLSFHLGLTVLIYYLIMIIKKNEKSKSTILFVVSYWIAVISMILIYKNKVILSSYSFNQIVYSDNYKITVIIQIAIIFFLIYRAFGENHITIATLFGGKVFESIVDMTNQYVFLTDRYGNIVYKNSISNNIGYFKEIKFDINKMENNFLGEITIEKKYFGKEYIKQIYNDEVKYYMYDKIRLLNEYRYKGYIIIVSDITEIIILAIDLDKKRKTIEDVNSKLIEYSKNVYELEKEESINRILEDIITKRINLINKLIDDINKIQVSLETGITDVVSAIDNAIKLNYEILSEVRQAVSSSREFYGGNYDKGSNS